MRAFSKKALTSLDILILTNELRKIITHSYIVNIYGADGESYIFKIRDSYGKIHHLYIEPGVRLNLTKYLLEKSSKGKIQLFRRFLRNAFIEDIKQLEFERVVIIKIRRGQLEGKLIIELIPRGVVVLTDNNDNILITSDVLEVKDRVIKIGRKYVPPPTLPNVVSYSVEKLVGILRESEEGKLGSLLIRKLGIPPEVVNEVLNERIRGTDIRRMSVDELMNVLTKVKEFISGVIKAPKPTIVVNDRNEYVSFHPFRPKNLWKNNIRFLEFESFNEVVDEYFRSMKAKEISKYETTVIESKRERLEKVLSHILKEFHITYSKKQDIKHLLNIISNNYVEIEEAHNCVRNHIKSYGWSNVVEKCGISEVNPRNGTISILLDNTKIELSIKEDFKSQYFKLMKELSSLERKLRRIIEKKNEVEKQIAELTSRREFKEVSPLLRLSEWYMSYYWLITPSGCLAIGGRNAEQNEKIVRRYLRRKDIFMHADIHGAPVFIIFTDNCSFTERDLYEVAVLAASYSKAWKLGLASVDVFWVYGDQVSTKAPPGQYLPKGSFMIYGRKNYIRNVSLSLSIGIEIVDGRFYRVIAGSENYVNSKSIAYITIIPGDKDPEVITREFMESVKSSIPPLRRLSSDDILPLIPGKSRIVKTIIKNNNLNYI